MIMDLIPRLAALLDGLAGLPIFPDQGSTIAEGVDHLHYFLTALTLFFTFIIFSTIFYFAVKYRRRSEDERPAETKTYLPLELTWTLVPTGLCVIVFVWGSSLYFRNSRPPTASMEIFVVGKQWMWHLQHPEGPREINELHIPVGVPVKLTMTSEDVIHDFYVPAFRVKKDVLPGRYTSLWFEPTKTGTFHLFCAQYCGAFHAGMIGSIIVADPDEYEMWLTGVVLGETMEAAGERLFQQFGCATCHLAGGAGQGPSLLGVYGRPVHLSKLGVVLGETMEAAGERLFQQFGCATCHLAGGAGQGPSLLGVYGRPVHLSNGQ